MANFSIKIIDRIVMPKYNAGRVWGVEQYEILEDRRNCNPSRLIWWPGHSYWGGRMAGRLYHPAELLFFGKTKIGLDFRHDGLNLLRKLRLHKPRLGKKLFQHPELVKFIDDHFDPGTAARIDPRKTLILE